ncbi:hypothetical protein J3L18_29170 [Mucilaginibacter gossypii]|uniref:hypothetical protein n=1 Tax=Mucilaginibacter gossypii TaxID=551996 RepID=UPI000DCBC586|nr:MULTISPECIES: hypothetical protein [Mucilaginibacter]QTE37134.1 hypothetical protein J3L18_29170 [Mucilaginibacter gossypii]RAV59113.1 hypothetical protein DIU36_07750 [Mucilaginibacter rubeus]
MDLKIKSQISQTTVLQTQAIIEKILFQLNEKEYRLINETDKSVKFDISQWQLRWNFEPTRLDGGEFEVSTADNCTMVSLTYYNDLLIPLIMLAALSTLLLIDGQYEGIIFFGAFYLITGIIHLITSKTKAKELLNDILDITTSDTNQSDEKKDIN